MSYNQLNMCKMTYDQLNVCNVIYLQVNVCNLTTISQFSSMLKVAATPFR